MFRETRETNISPQMKNKITDVKTIMEGAYRILDIIKTQMTKLDVNFKITFTNYLRKKEERT